MFLTEEEAGKKICPHTTYCENPEHVTHYDKAAIMTSCNCAASDCMAWRWRSEDRKIKEAPSYEYPSGRIVATPVGFCGLAGRPTR